MTRYMIPEWDTTELNAVLVASRASHEDEAIHTDEPPTVTTYTPEEHSHPLIGH
jgi:hypothetical protein